MKSWRSRIAVALGTAALALPLAAGSASAAEADGGLYHPISGTPDYAECMVDGWNAIASGRYSHYLCVWEDPYWNLYVVDADRPM